jgi:hypothetical protein
LFRGDCFLCWYGWNCWPSLFRGDCLICWYWRNCWPSLFRGDCLFFYIGGIVDQQIKNSPLRSDGQ